MYTTHTLFFVRAECHVWQKPRPYAVIRNVVSIKLFPSVIVYTILSELFLWIRKLFNNWPLPHVLTTRLIWNWRPSAKWHRIDLLMYKLLVQWKSWIERKKRSPSTWEPRREPCKENNLNLLFQMHNEVGGCKKYSRNKNKICNQQNENSSIFHS